MENTAFIHALNCQLGIPEIAEVVEGNGGLPKISITGAAAMGEMYLHGAHVTSWRPEGADEIFFVSEKSRWENGHAIRGGVPVCFPWFADKLEDPKAPAHGFVRTKMWQLESVVDTGAAIAVSMATATDAGTKQWWPFEFRLTLRASFGSELVLELTASNTGDTALRFEEALHSYLRVAEVREAVVSGLDAVHYLDKTDDNREKPQQGDIVITAETDRVYLDTRSPLQLVDPGLRRSIRIAQENSRTTVIWNPWAEKSRAMSDLSDDEWTRMLCVETSNVLNYAVELAPGQQHCMKSSIRIMS
jgi:glucose-6-phosphate 1-epimerase